MTRRDLYLAAARRATDPDTHVGITTALGFAALVVMHLAGWLS